MILQHSLSNLRLFVLLEISQQYKKCNYSNKDITVTDFKDTNNKIVLLEAVYVYPHHTVIIFL